MLTLLHTSPAHIPRFDALRDRLAPRRPLNHAVRADWLARAQPDGPDAALCAEIAAFTRNAPGPVLCTCTTLGVAAEAAGAIRIDRPLMQAAAKTGGPVLLVWCLLSTAGASRALLADCGATRPGGLVIAELALADLWPLFEAGDQAGFAAQIAARIRAHLHEAPQRLAAVVLAQASMADAAPLLADLAVPVLASPALALEAALAAQPTGPAQTAG